MSKQWSKCLLISVLFFPTCFISAFANDAVILLNQMNDALHQLEYQGRLVYTKDGEASNLLIRHTVENGREKEVVSLLDENGDEYVKESIPFSLSSLPKITTAMQKVYSFDIGGMGKVAGRPCQIVLARPKDKKRYLQRYCIDLDRTIVLKYSLINQKKKLVESFMFTDFHIISSSGDVVDELANNLQAVSSVNAEGSIVLSEASITEKRIVSESSNSASPRAKGWLFDSLPAGFKIVSVDKVKNPEDEQIIISDGLSSVSVFVSADKNVTKPPVQPISSGALNILSRMYHGHAITLMGEVPKATLNDIFNGMKKATITQ